VERGGRNLQKKKRDAGEDQRAETCRFLIKVESRRGGVVIAPTHVKIDFVFDDGLQEKGKGRKKRKGIHSAGKRGGEFFSSISVGRVTKNIKLVLQYHQRGREGEKHTSNHYF